VVVLLRLSWHLVSLVWKEWVEEMVALMRRELIVLVEKVFV